MDSGSLRQSQFLIPPPARTGLASSVGAACSNARTSNRFDLPEPFGPIRTLRGFSSSLSPSGPKDRRFLTAISRKNGLFGLPVSFILQHRPLNSEDNSTAVAACADLIVHEHHERQHEAHRSTPGRVHQSGGDAD